MQSLQLRAGPTGIPTRCSALQSPARCKARAAHPRNPQHPAGCNLRSHSRRCLRSRESTTRPRGSPVPKAKHAAHAGCTGWPGRCQTPTDPSRSNMKGSQAVCGAAEGAGDRCRPARPPRTYAPGGLAHQGPRTHRIDAAQYPAHSWDFGGLVNLFEAIRGDKRGCTQDSEVAPQPLPRGREQRAGITPPLVSTASPVKRGEESLPFTWWLCSPDVRGHTCTNPEIQDSAAENRRPRGEEGARRAPPRPREGLAGPRFQPPASAVRGSFRCKPGSGTPGPGQALAPLPGPTG